MSRERRSTYQLVLSKHFLPGISERDLINGDLPPLTTSYTGTQRPSKNLMTETNADNGLLVRLHNILDVFRQRQDPTIISKSIMFWNVLVRKTKSATGMGSRHTASSEKERIHFIRIRIDRVPHYIPLADFHVHCRPRSICEESLENRSIVAEFVHDGLDGCVAFEDSDANRSRHFVCLVMDIERKVLRLGLRLSWSLF